MAEKLNSPGESFGSKAKRWLWYGAAGAALIYLGLEIAPEAIHVAAENLGEIGAEITLHTHEAISGVVGADIVHPAVYS